jgi:N-acetylmuramoyl-L-alanine amidase
MFIFFPVFLLSLLSITPPVQAAVRQADLAKQYRITRIYHRNLAAGVIESSRSNWQWGVRSFQKIYKAAGQSELALYARFRGAGMYHDMARRFSNPVDLGEAVVGFETVARLAPAHSLADDALFNLAMIYLEDKKDINRAAKGFDYIVRTYPKGDMAKAAAQKLLHLKRINSAGKQVVPTDGRPRIHAINHWSTGNYSRIVIKATSPLRFKEHLDDRKGRLTVNFERGSIDRQQVPPVIYGEGLLRKITTSRESQNVRVELEADLIEKYRLMTMYDPFRLVIDMKGAMRQPYSKLPKSIKAVKRKWKNNNIADTRPSLARQLGLGIRKIVVDAGHGGKDPGAIGAGGLKEKDVTLAVAVKLAEKLKRDSFEVVLTRSRDVFLPLEERTAIANTKKGDIFVSIHVNASKSSEKNGVETYILDLTDDEDSMRLAARENATSAAGMSDLQEILAGLLNNTKIEESTLLARAVQKSMTRGLRLKDRGVRKAPFYVLTGALMPAILAEVSFITNPVEAGKLRDDRYLEVIAGQLAAGLAEYARQQEVAMQ